MVKTQYKDEKILKLVLERLMNLEKIVGELQEQIRQLKGSDINRDFTTDPMLGVAENLLKQYELISASLLQRRLSIGYARAARLIDLLEEKGLIGKAIGSKPRKVIQK